MGRKTGAIKTFSSLWQNHEKLYFSIFYNALTQLKISDEQRNDEDAISEELCPILRRICFEHIMDVRTPEWERPIQPVKKEELKGGKTRKRPDFSCTLLNSMALSKEMYEIPLHIECKRLGKKVGSWNLIKNYVNNGIERFDITSHEYGKLAPSGMMIGYIINMEPLVIIDEVNKCLPVLFTRLDKTFSNKVSYYNQKLLRKNVKPKRFKLIHLWADLR